MPTFKTILRYALFGLFLLLLWGIKKAFGGK